MGGVEWALTWYAEHNLVDIILVEIGQELQEGAIYCHMLRHTHGEQPEGQNIICMIQHPFDTIHFKNKYINERSGNTAAENDLILQSVNEGLFPLYGLTRS